MLEAKLEFPNKQAATIQPLLECPEIVELVKGRSWKEGGPITMSELSYLRIPYWNFNGAVQVGELIVNSKIATQVLQVFKDLFEIRFPIQSMILIDRFFKPEERYKEGIDSEIDDRSMNANNTSALFVRRIANSEQWSNHSTGTAIDINPLHNPLVVYADNNYVIPLKVFPEAGKNFVNREALQKGMVNKSVTDAFIKRGFFWGGAWKDPDNKKDYQHFSTEPRDALKLKAKL